MSSGPGVLVAIRIDNLEPLRSLFDGDFADCVVDAAGAFLRSRLAAAPDLIGDVIAHASGDLDLVVRAGADAMPMSGARLRQRVQSWCAALGRASLGGRDRRAHVALSWASVEIVSHFDNGDVLSLLLSEARGRLASPVQCAVVQGGERDLAVRDMAATVELYEELDDGGVQFAWQPVRGLTSGDTLYLRAFLGAPAQDGAIVGRGLSYRSIERLGLTEAFDQTLVLQAIRHLALSDSPAVCVTVSASSFRLTPWWDAILARLEQDRWLARRLFVALDCAQFPVRIADAVTLADRLRGLGCRLAIEGFGGGQASVATLLALRPEIVSLESFFVRLATHRAPDERLFRHLVGLADAVVPVVVVEGVDTQTHASLAVDAGAHWGRGAFLGGPSWRGPTKPGQAATQVAAFGENHPNSTPAPATGGGA